MRMLLVIILLNCIGGIALTACSANSGQGCEPDFIQYYNKGRQDEILTCCRDNPTLLLRSDHEKLLELAVLDNRWEFVNEVLPLYFEYDILNKEIIFIILSRPCEFSEKFLEKILEEKDWSNVRHNDEGWLPIEVASVNRLYKSVQVLLRHGADVNMASSVKGFTYIEMVEYYYSQSFDMKVQPSEDVEVNLDWRDEHRSYWWSVFELIIQEQGREVIPDDVFFRINILRENS